MADKRKTVLITGCSSGIGEDAAKFLVEKGWTVFAGVRTEADVEKLRTADSNLKPIILDVTKEDQVRRAVEEIRVAVGEDGLDGLVNNAGMSISGPFEFTDMSDIRRQFDVNIFGVIQLTQEALPLLRMGKPGRIVNIGSIGCHQHLPFLSFYCSTKSALVSLNEGLRREVAQFGMKVVLIKPGPVKTNFEKTAAGELDALIQRYPTGSPCRELYGKSLDIAPKAAATFEKYNVSPRCVSNRILTALTASNPKNMYFDTWGTYFTACMLEWLPVSWIDSMIASVFGLN